MEMTYVEKLGESLVLTFPTSIIEALHLYDGEKLSIEVEGDRIVLTRAPAEFLSLWVTYRKLGQHRTSRVSS